MIRSKKNQMQFISHDSLSITRDYTSDETGHGLYHPADIDGILQFSAKTHPMSAIEFTDFFMIGAGLKDR